MKGGATIETIETASPDLIKLAGEHERAGRLDEAMQVIDQAIAADPKDAEAVHLKGVIAYRQGDVAAAAGFMEQSIKLKPLAKYLRNICEAYRILGRYDDALKAGRAAVEGDPNDPLCHANLSVLHYERGEPADAARHAASAVKINPEIASAHLGMAEALLIEAEFERGWEEYDWRYKLPGVPNPMPLKDIPPWDGKPMKNGAILLVADQGYGDGIQFGRYIPWARERVGKVVVACSKELQPLISQIPGIDFIFDAWDSCPKVDAWETLSGLPRHHRTRLDNIPWDGPYLKAEPAVSAKWRARLDELAPPGRTRIGLVWAGRPTHMNDRNRSVSLSRFAPITDIDGITFVSLQKGPATDQIGGYFGRAPLVNLGPEVSHFGESAAVINELDLMLSVDTSVAHVAGAMGKTSWVMLPYAPDWRWLRERGDTPWYPSMRLFRPPAPKDWESVIAEVVKELRAGAWKKKSRPRS